MVSALACALASTILIGHVLNVIDSQKRSRTLFLDEVFRDIALVILVICLSFMGSHGPSRILAIISVFTHISDLFHDFTIKVLLNKESKHMKNWYRTQRIEIRETFIKVLHTLKKANDHSNLT